MTKTTPTKNEIQRFRYDTNSWNQLADAAPGGNRSAVLKQLIDWYIGRPGAALPERPARAGERAPTMEIDGIPLPQVREILRWWRKQPST